MSETTDAATGAATGAAAGTAVSPGVGTVVGAGLGVLGGVLSSHIEQSNYEKNQSALFRMNQLAERNAVVNRKQSLLAAGLSPALADGSASATSVGSAPMQNRQMNLGDYMQNAAISSGIELQRAQADNVRAQTEGIKSETGLKDIELNRQHAADAWADAYAKVNFPELYADFKKKYPNEGLNLGFIAGREKLLDSFVKDSDRELHLSQNELQSLITNIQKQSPKIYSAMASLPADKRNEIYANIARLNFLNQVSKSEVGLMTSQTEESKQRTKQIKEAIEKLRVDIADTLVNNPATAAYLGNDKAAVIGYLDDFVGYVGDAGKQAIGAYGMSKAGKAIGTAKAAADAAKPAPPNFTEKTVYRRYGRGYVNTRSRNYDSPLTTLGK